METVPSVSGANAEFFPSLFVCVEKKSFTAVYTVYTLLSSLSDVPCKFDAAYFAVTVYNYVVSALRYIL